MPWRGPSEPGEWPTLGWQVIDWIEEFLIVPGGPRRGHPFILTDEQARHLLHVYRLHPKAKVHPKYPRPVDGLVYYGAHLRRSQKWGKDPLAAARCIAHALGPVQFNGWDADGEPVARPVEAPWVQVAGTSDDATDNTYRPLFRMLSEGPLADTPGLDIGETRIKLPAGDGWIEPVTAAAKSRLGQPITFANFTEPHLMTERDGGQGLARAMKRNIAGMGGSWSEPLALDTPVPTPTGWSTMGDLEPGDTVYDSAGQPVEVRRATPVFRDLACYRVEFDDGEAIVASGSHSWTVQATHRKRSGRRVERTLTTDELVALLPRWTLSVPRVAVEGTPRDLPVDPYYLGLWLGDGASDDSWVCSAHRVADELAALLKAGLPDHEDLVVDRSHPTHVRFRPRRRHRLCRWGHDWSDDEMGNGTLRSGRPSVTCGACQRGEPRADLPTMTTRERLRALGVLGDKHIPRDYLLASRPQRLALLRGLMDSDGYLSATGKAQFSNTNEALARNVQELAVSLGQKVTLTRYDCPDRGQPAYYVTFRPTQDEPVNELSYKRERHRLHRGPCSERRFITAVAPVAPVPTRCIGLDTSDHLFVVGRHNTLTHNCTNAWDPSENSVAQQTGEGKAPGIFIDHRHPELPRLTPAEFEDDKVVLERIVVKYGDSCRKRGGWIDERSILEQVRDPSTGEAEARRYFLDEVTVGERDAVDATRWAALSRPGELLERGAAVALGFDGSRVSDATALVACRIEDGRWFRLGVWVPAEYGGKVPEHLVDQAVKDAAAAYEVWHVIADPYRWQTNINRWDGELGKNRANQPVVVEFPTNVDRRMDAAVDLWETAYRTGEGEFTHDGDPTVTRHALAAAVGVGGRKAPREDGQAQVSDRYRRVVKKKQGVLIDAFVAGILATFGRGMAIEHGALAAAAAPSFAFVDLWE